MQCNTNTQQCECKEGFFTSDCSISAILVPSENAMMNVLQPLSWTYFYTNIGTLFQEKCILHRKKAMETIMNSL